MSDVPGMYAVLREGSLYYQRYKSLTHKFPFTYVENNVIRYLPLERKLGFEGSSAKIRQKSILQDSLQRKVWRTASKAKFHFISFHE